MEEVVRGEDGAKGVQISKSNPTKETCLIKRHRGTDDVML